MEEADIRALAATREYTISNDSDTKAEVINDFLSEQELKYVFTQEELNELTIGEIETIATARSYTITETLKADIITEFLTQQNA